MDLTGFREQFPITRERIHLFAGAMAPAALPVHAALSAWGEDWRARPLAAYERVAEEMEALRCAFAALIGADPDEVAITDGTSRAAAIAIHLLAGRPRGTVVVDETTYPSNRYPWRTLGGKRLRHVPLTGSEEPAAALAAQLDDDVAVVTVSHVAPLTGHRHQLRPLADAAHAAGALLMVDAAQSTGAVDLDVRRDGVDVLVTTAMKWLLGPPGIGFLYIRRDLLEAAPIKDVGPYGVVVAEEEWPLDALPQPAAGARRLEPGCPAAPGLAAARAGIELVAEVGVPVLEAQVERLSRRVHELLTDAGVPVRTPLDAHRRAGVIAADHPRAVALGDFLAARGIDVGVTPWGLVRVDPHAYLTLDEIERFGAALADFQRTG